MGADFEDEYAVYPFRRQVLEEQTGTFPALPTLRAPRRRRRRLEPLRFAVPVALVAFVAAVAGSAMVSNRHRVQQVLDTQLTPAAEAAPRPVRHTARHAEAARAKLLFVPDVTGLPAKQAAVLLKREQFRPRLRFATGKPGHVLAQRPKAATGVGKVGLVVLTVGRAAPKPKPEPRPARPIVQTVIVTSVVGLQKDVAVKALLAEGLGIRIYGVPSAKPSGTVVAQAPRGGSRERAGRYVRINVAL